MRRAVLSITAACLAASCVARAESEPQQKRFPISSDYPAGVMERTGFTAAVPERWRISALQTPNRADAPWKIVIITGTPSWSEYWAPTIAATPQTREVIVADRPGFAQSEPRGAVEDLEKQAEALSPMLAARPGQRVLLLGQSFGAPVATLMAERYRDQVDALVLVSAYFGDRGPTARRMVGVGAIVQGVLPRDLRNSIAELRAQPPQLPAVWTALRDLDQPLVFIHGDDDTFVPLSATERIARDYRHSLITVPGGDHFLNACCVAALQTAIEQAIEEAERGAAAHPPSQASLDAAP